MFLQTPGKEGQEIPEEKVVPVSSFPCQNLCQCEIKKNSMSKERIKQKRGKATQKLGGSSGSAPAAGAHL